MNLAQIARNDVQGKFPGAAVVERTLHSIKHQVAPGRFALWAHVSPIHISGTETEIDTAWVDADPVTDAPWLNKMTLADYNVYAGPGDLNFDSGQIVRYLDPISGAEIAFQPMQLQWSNDLGQIEAIGDPAAVSAAINDDTLTWVDAFGAGLHFVWENQTARLAKRLIITSLADIGTPPAFIISGGNPYLKLQFIFQKSNDVDIWIDGVLWNEASNNPQTTGNAVEFRDSGNNLLWFFAPAYGSDTSTGPDAVQEVPASYHFRKQANNLFVEVRVPWSWLETAVYPVVVDPTVNPQVAASADDAHEDHTGSNFSSSGTIINCTANTSPAANRRYYGAARFQVSVPNAATVNQAYTTVVANGTGADDPNVTQACEDIDNAPDFSTNADVDGRTRTSATASWVTTGIGTSPVNSPDIDACVQEVLDRAGWASGQYMVCFWDGNGDFNSTFQLVSYDQSTSNAPKLFIDYSTGGEQLAANISRIRRQRATYLRM